jgi:PleD family two-component response regulator
MFPANGTNAEQLLNVADQTLYRAKEEGRDRVVSASRPAGVPVLR